MLKSRHNSVDIESVTELLCEQYLPRVFQYINCWINGSAIAEEITLKALKKALVKYRNCYKDEKKFSTGLFRCARNEILGYLKVSTVKPILPGLSTQEQEVISLRLAAMVNNGMISKLLGLSESKVGTIVHQSLCKLKDQMEVPA
ncbi:MAG: sigma-70 family RNA polymerase sigma factor [Dehalococcoidales bacterium]|nr:sigma-70 family RNA polymerase sigma factor [Dehalococcoidales bacterium]